MLTGKNWSVDIREKTAIEVRKRVSLRDEIPDSVKAVIYAALDALPPDRGDLGVMVNASGHIGSWDEYKTACDAMPGLAPGIAKPQGFMSLWVGYTTISGPIIRA